MSWPARIGSALVLLALLALVLLFAAACGPQDDDQFTRDCTRKGWVVHTRHVGNSTSRSCDPPPVPTPGPNGRWQ